MTAHKIMLVTKLLLQSFVLLTGFLSLLAQSMSQEVCKGKCGVQCTSAQVPRLATVLRVRHGPTQVLRGPVQQDARHETLPSGALEEVQRRLLPKADVQTQFMYVGHVRVRTSVQRRHTRIGSCATVRRTRRT